MSHHRYALPAGLLLAALAVPAPAHGALDSSAGWHGREIRAPYAGFADRPTPQFPRGWSAGAVGRGSGDARRGGSQRVRELQRRLLRRGYRPGRADGRFGARTQAAVTWFQVKHGLARTGRGDAATIARLRDRSRPVRPADAAVPAAAAVTATPPAAVANGTDMVALVLLGLVILAGLALIAAWLWHALRTGPDAPTVPDEKTAAGVPRTATIPDEKTGPPAATVPDEKTTTSVPPVSTVREEKTAASIPPAPPVPQPKSPRLSLVPRPNAHAPVLGYVAIAREGDLEISARAIGAWCDAHGWSLAKVVHDSLPARGRPGLEHALEEIRARRAAGLVLNRLQDFTDSVPALGPLLQWFVDADAFVIALDYELDTSSRPGEVAARALVEVSDWAQAQQPRRGAARGAAVADDPELAARITAMRAGGMSLQAIADALNDAGVPTLRGGSRWRPSSVQAATGYKRPPAKSRGIELPRLSGGE